MKVYIVIEYSLESSEVVGVYDSLGKAQAYRNGQSGDWATGAHINKWWERTIVETGPEISLNVHIGISEWELNNCEIEENSLDSPKFQIGDIVNFINKNIPEEYGEATIKDIEPSPTYHLKDDEGREWIHVKQDYITLAEKD